MLFSQKTNQKSFTSVIADYTTGTEVSSMRLQLVLKSKIALTGW